MEMKHSRYNLFLKLTSLQKLLKTSQIAILENLKIFSINAYKKIKFPDLMIKAEITRVLKKLDNTLKENYPISAPDL